MLHTFRVKEKRNKKSSLSYLFYSLVAFFFCLTNPSSFAQEDKSHVIVTVDGVRYYSHVVVKGQTLYSIAKLYDQAVGDVVLQNPHVINGLKKGEKLKIALENETKIVAAVPALDTINFRYHLIQPKETLYSISKQYGLSVDQLVQLNNGVSTALQAGSTIKVAKLEPAKKELNDEYVELEVLSLDYTLGYEGEVKSVYNVAYFLPFNISQDQLMRLDPERKKKDPQYSRKAIIALNFYQGSLLALEDLKAQGINVNVYVYDSQDSLDYVLKSAQITQMDLIIGPLYTDNFVKVATVAKENHIPLVSPFIKANKILFDNPYVCKATTSTTLQMTLMAEYVADEFHVDNVVLVNRNFDKEKSYSERFLTVYNATLENRLYDTTNTVSQVSDIEIVEYELDSLRKNVVILPSTDQAYVTSFINKIHTLTGTYDITIFGMHNWLKYDNLDLEYLNNMSLHVVENNFENKKDERLPTFVDKYKQTYRTRPHLYAYNGYDISTYFISALDRYGEGFLNYLSDYKAEGLMSNFDFIKSANAESGFENKDVFILHYHDYELLKAKK